MSDNFSRSESDRDYGRIGFSEGQADLLAVASKFCHEKSPIERVRQLMVDEDGYDGDVWNEIVELGWLGIAIPEEYGGVGLSLAEVAPVMEQMGSSMLATPFLSTTLAAQAILAGGSEAQKEQLLPQIVEGQIATLALFGDSADWDFENIEAGASDAIPSTLSGKKRLVCDADKACWIIASVMRQGKPGLVIIERSAVSEGALHREISVDETKRSYALQLDGVTVKEDAFFDSNNVLSTLKHIHLVGSLLSAAESCGGAKAVIDYTVGYLNTRKQFGRLIGSFQGLKHPTVEAYVQYEKARSHLYAAAHSFGDQGAGEIATRMAKVAADTAFSYASDRSIQFHGGFGFTYDCDAQLYRRRAAWHAALYGDAAYHKKCLAELLF